MRRRFFAWSKPSTRTPIDLARVDAELDALFAADPQPTPIEVLTIHKAKGLQFDHVVIPFSDRGTRPEGRRLLSWRVADGNLIMGVSGQPMHDWLTREESKRASNELVRLLYVACTRARKSLLVTAGSVRAPANSFAALLQDEYHDTARPQATPVTQVQLLPTTERFRLRSDYRWTPPALPTLPGSAERSPPADDPGSLQDVAIGEIVHAALARLAASPADPAVVLADLRQHWMLDLADRGITGGGDALATIERQLETVLADETGRWLLRQHHDSRVELELSGVEDGHAIRVRLDRCFVDEHGQRWIVDYKTGRPRGSSEAFVTEQLARHRAQLVRYGQIAAAAFDCKPKLAIYFTGLPKLVEVDFSGD